MQVPFIDLAKLIADAGFPGGVAQANGIAIVCAESGRDPAATFTNTDGSIDRGLWQINSKWHAEVTDAEAFDPKEATAAAFKISSGGTDFTPWSTWASHAYVMHVEAARVALDALARISKLQAQLAATSSALTATQAQVSVLQQKLADEVDLCSALQTKIAAAKAALA